MESTSATVQREIERCARCGKCRSSCPVFALVLAEPFVARGRIALTGEFIKGALKNSPELAHYLGACSWCLSCAELCPSGVAYEKVLLYAKRELAGRKRARFLPLVFRYLLPRRWLWDGLLRGLAALQSFLPREHRAAGARLRHLPLALAGGRGSLPELAGRSFLRERLPLPLLVHPLRQPSGRRVFLFTGCLVNYVYPGVARAAARLLAALGCEVVISREQVCCGLPARFTGYEEEAKLLAARNLKAFRTVDDVATPCASCGKNLKGYPELLGEALPARVRDVNELLLELGLAGLLRAAAEASAPRPRLAYHDPCHLGRGQRLRAQPRQLLASAGELVELSPREVCCGGAGSFSLNYWELARALGEKRWEAFRASGAEELVTSCPGCIMQLEAVAAARGEARRVWHTVELLERSLPRRRQGAVIFQ